MKARYLEKYAADLWKYAADLWRYAAHLWMADPADESAGLFIWMNDPVV